MADRAGICFPSQEFLATVTGLSARTVRKALKSLTDQKLIRRQHRRVDDIPISDLITVLWLAEVADLLKRGGDWHGLPVPTGTDCRQTEQIKNTRYYQESLEDIELLERMPEPDNPTPIENKIRELAASLRVCCPNIDWTAGLTQDR